MDRRIARRRILRTIGEIENRRDYLLVLEQEIDASGDPILAGELRKYTGVLTNMLDAMYVWAGKI